MTVIDIFKVTELEFIVLESDGGMLVFNSETCTLSDFKEIRHRKVLNIKSFIDFHSNVPYLVLSVE